MIEDVIAEVLQEGLSDLEYEGKSKQSNSAWFGFEDLADSEFQRSKPKRVVNRQPQKPVSYSSRYSSSYSSSSNSGRYARTSDTSTRANGLAVGIVVVGAVGLAVWAFNQEEPTTSAPIYDGPSLQANASIVRELPLSVATPVEEAKPCDGLAASLNLSRDQAAINAIRTGCIESPEGQVAALGNPDESAANLNALQLQALSEPDAPAEGGVGEP